MEDMLKKLREKVVLCIYSREYLNKVKIYNMLKHSFYRSEITTAINTLLGKGIIEPTLNYKISNPHYQLTEDKYKQVSELLNDIML